MLLLLLVTTHSDDTGSQAENMTLIVSSSEDNAINAILTGISPIIQIAENRVKAYYLGHFHSQKTNTLTDCTI